MTQININAGNLQGHVILHDPLTMLQLAEYEEAFEAAVKIDKRLVTARSNLALIPALVSCVKEWHITLFPETLTLDTFPGIGTGISKPDIVKVVVDITNALSKYFKGESPNA